MLALCGLSETAINTHFRLRKSILYPFWNKDLLELLNRFDQWYPTCYKSSFCAGVPRPESYFSGRIFAASVSS